VETLAPIETGDTVAGLDGLDVVEVPLVGILQGPERLDGDHLRTAVGDAEPLQVLEPTPDADQSVGVGARLDHPVGGRPAERLADLVGDGLVALNAVVVAAYRRGDVVSRRVPVELLDAGLHDSPAILGGRGRYDARPVHLHQRRHGLGDLREGEDDAVETGSSRVGGRRGPVVVRRRDRHHVRTQFDSLRDGDRGQAILERPGRVLALVFQVELLQLPPVGQFVA
jgi:hypothetical protein